MRRILPIACVAFAFTVGLSAQSTGTGSSTQETSQKASSAKSSKSSGRAVTLTGCLQQGDTPGTFQLTNVDMSGMHAKSGKGMHSHSGTATSGSASGSTSGTESSSQSSQSSMGNMGNVTLVAGGSTDLSKHVGHKVQVTGTWASSGAAGTSGMASEPGSAPSSGSKSGSSASGRELTVKSLKHISETCQ